MFWTVVWRKRSIWLLKLQRRTKPKTTRRRWRTTRTQFSIFFMLPSVSVSSQCLTQCSISRVFSAFHPPVAVLQSRRRATVAQSASRPAVWTTWTEPSSWRNTWRRKRALVRPSPSESPSLTTKGETGPQDSGFSGECSVSVIHVCGLILAKMDSSLYLF